MKYTIKSALLILFAICSTSIQAQVFSLNEGFQRFPAQQGGIPNIGNGTVLVRRAPSATGRANVIRNILNQATVPDSVIDSRLTQGRLANHIAQMPAVISTANRLNNRPNERSNLPGAIIINGTTALNQNRGRLRDNSSRTFIFRGTINTNSNIDIGSNKNIWIDGRINWSGREIPVTEGDSFSPLGTIPQGMFNIIDKQNININGTKRGLLDSNTYIPAIYAFNSSDINVNGIEVINGYNSIVMHQSWRVAIKNSFVYNSVRRGIHMIAVGRAVVENNLVFDSYLDGIDIDAFSSEVTVVRNVIVGAKNRHLLWTEIDANNNLMNNNVGIHLGEARGKYAGGFEENGTEIERRNNPSFRGTRNNRWTNNNVFYARSARDGVYMVRDRFIQHRTISYNNNYVWTVGGNIQRHNPRPEQTLLSDVRFLTLRNPRPGNRPNPRNTIAPGLNVFLRDSPAPLRPSQIVSTRNRGS